MNKDKKPFTIKRDSSLYQMANRYYSVSKKVNTNNWSIDLCTYTRCIMKSALTTIWWTMVAMALILALVDMSVIYGWHTNWYLEFSNESHEPIIVNSITSYNAILLVPLALMSVLAKMVILAAIPLSILVLIIIGLCKGVCYLYTAYRLRRPPKKTNVFIERAKAAKSKVCPILKIE